MVLSGLRISCAKTGRELAQRGEPLGAADGSLRFPQLLVGLGQLFGGFLMLSRCDAVGFRKLMSEKSDDQDHDDDTHHQFLDPVRGYKLIRPQPEPERDISAAATRLAMKVPRSPKVVAAEMTGRNNTQ